MTCFKLCSLSISTCDLRRGFLVAGVLLALSGLGPYGWAAGTKDESAALPADLSADLLAHWAFDHDPDGRLVEDRSTGRPAIRADVPHQPGVIGRAIQLTGSHTLDTVPLDKSELTELSFSVWVRPSDLGGYRELFRQECERRLLFSFQGSGSILSLGLNIHGYVECDASLDPAHILDGFWHHAAGTFDGETMRVFLDGREIGQRTRSGTIAVNSTVRPYIGSSSGRGEFFQGGLDDLRVYGRALSPEQIRTLYDLGNKGLAARGKAVADRLNIVYKPEATFLSTLTKLRAMVAGSDAAHDRDVAGFLSARLKTDFPSDYGEFSRLISVTPWQFLVRPEAMKARSLAQRLVEQMREYEPLTADQRNKLTPDQRAHWRRIDGIASQCQTLVMNDEPDSSPRWIAVALAAGRHVQERPAKFEAVAPYRRPDTPATVDYSPAEADELLCKDWLFQAGGSPTGARIEREIDWARRLLDRLRTDPRTNIDVTRFADQLDLLNNQLGDRSAVDRDLYIRVRRVKRRIMLANPVIDFDRVLFVDMPYPDGGEWRHETRHRLGYMAVPGARLSVLDGLSPEGHLRQLMPKAPLHGSFWRPDLSFDGRRVLFCFKPHNEKSFHLYEIGIDGTGLRQLTDGPYDDLDPIYLPDDRHVMFSTTRGHTYVRCMPPTNAYVLARCDSDGSDIYLVSRNNEPDYLPSLLADGRVVYTRWEYTDKPLWRAQGLWTVNTDGTHVNTLWGNQSVWPDLLKDARAVPGSRRIMFTGSAHHDWFSGSIGMIDPAQGFNFPHGLTKVTADVAWPESGNGPIDRPESPNYHSSGAYGAYYSPFPLSEKDFLVSASRAGKFMLYLMDVDGNRELIYEGAHNIFHAIPVRARRRPPVTMDRVAWPEAHESESPRPGVLFSDNIYQGVDEALKGKARYLRILNIEPKTYTYWYKRPYLSTGPVVSAVQSEGVKRILGTVPIEPDGSISFYAPSGVALHFQLLDPRYRALQTMRSFTGVMPGERRGCTGCHESHSAAPNYGRSAMALRAPPRKITPPPWGDESISYARFARPTLDRYCADCHQNDPEARADLDLTVRTGFLFFEEPYLVLTGRPAWGTAYRRPANAQKGLGIANMLMVEGYEKTDPAAYQTPRPMMHLSYSSRLIELASSGEHYGVRVDSANLRRLIAWVDAMCPYRGHEEVCDLPDPEFPGVDWLAIRPRIRTAPTIRRPGPVK